ncbi:hypothetical protein EXH51_04645 [Pelomonas saccharophila]|nr:hypothetical protein [Roseateles saccharophilus]
MLGHGLPAEAEAALREAGLAQGDAVRAMSALMRANRLAPAHPAVLIAFYRHYFYGHRPRLARAVARKALVSGALALGLPQLWRDVPDTPLPGARDDAATRFYLWVLKGYAYLSLRLGDEREARAALAKLRALDPEDRVGAAVIEAARQRQQRSLLADDDDAAPALAITGAQAWLALDAALGSAT